MSDISKIDRNFAITDNIGGKEINFKNVLSEPFSVYGLIKETPFIRIPKEVAAATNDGVKGLNFNTSGGRVRFKTNSKEIAIRAKQPNKCLMSHMPFSGSSGFDLYCFNDGNYQYSGTFMPPTNRGDSFESVISLPDNTMRDITINFPLYDNVEELFVGIEPNAELLSADGYINSKPIIYYGSSITQGGCASRPGNSYQAMISRRFNCDYRNFGWSGSARGEDSITEYMANQPMSLFFLDYDHNSPSADHLKATHEKLYLKIREKNPEIPIIIASKTDIPKWESQVIDTENRKKIIYQTFENAVRRGDRNVRFIDGGSVFKKADNLNISPDCCTVDGCHPNDLGFACMAKVFGDLIGDMLGWL